ncbi:hypothetical protein Syun_030960 [Stephania yunnanensis]|uniref:non-specific serine/threonine protein kinase n=1 Tax=Stephania yunnanensis TaxID=152371 RepID=A0AAP0DZ51_9MAGN
MDISDNNLTGEIPNALGNCLSLELLSLMGNSFQGFVPSSFSSLKGLQILDLSLNNLSGQIPLFFQNLSSSLQYLNLSFNNFEGAVPTEGVFGNVSAFSILGNKKLCGGISELQLPKRPDKQKYFKKHQMPLYLNAVLVLILATIVLVTCVSVLLLMRRPKNETRSQEILHDHYDRVSFLDLHRATNGFSPTNLIGYGHFGSVFKGVIREGEKPVAVKVFNLIDHNKASKSFMAECEALRNVRHRNLMKIVTACATVDFQGSDFKAIIFKFMPNGSLEGWLHPVLSSNGGTLSDSLNQSQRIDIAVDIASALDYLHNQWVTPIVHCDLKPSNILLDEDMVAHVSEFGLAKFLQRTNSNCSGQDTTSSLSLRGTIGYIPPGSLSPYIGNLSFLHTIDLRNNSFRGEIPSSEVLGRLFRLRVFALGNNSFTGELPSNFSRNLESLILEGNKLSGTFPKQLCALQKLKTLALSSNNLTGSLPYDLGNLSSLQFIGLARNFLEGGIPDSIGQLKSLHFLALDENMLSSKLPPSIYNLSSLWTLALTMNQIVDRLPSDIGQTFLPNLRELCLGMDFGKVLDNMGNMQKLQFLGLSQNNQLGSSGHADDLKFLSSINSTVLKVIKAFDCQLSGILHKSLANISFTQLEELILSGNQISGIIPSEIFIKLPNLTRLYLRDNFLTGNIPQDIGKLNNLQALTLQNNNLSGRIPSSINNLARLLYLELNHNNFEGVVPNTSNLQSLLELDLSGNKLNATLEQVFGQTSHGLLYAYLANNSFTGSLPVEVGNFEHLVEMDVSNNYLEGEIPNTLGKCLSLQRLSLMGNSFRGSIPPSFSSLQGLTFLDLSQNNFSGQIPMFLQNLSSSWRYLNLSFNNFEGAMPTQGIFQNASAFSILGNNKLCGGISELQLPACPIIKQKRFGKHQISLETKSGTDETQKTSLYDHYERVSFLELHRATYGFSPKKLNWYRHFGSVFKAIIREGTEPVAVKVLNMIDHKASKSFMAECEALRNVRHRNLMKILTACSTVDFQGNDFKAVIFKFMPNGSLEKWLHPVRTDDQRYLTENLSLSRRLNIAIDVASALDYLHNQCETPIVHCDLKPSNILLDEDMVAHVGDFGLAKFLQGKNSNSSSTNNTSSFSPRGTIGYIPPEYGVGVKPSTQGDMHSYGVLLLEMFTGKRPTDEEFEDGLYLHQFCKIALHKGVMKIIDPHVLEHEEEANDDHRDIHVNNSEIQRRTHHESGKPKSALPP